MYDILNSISSPQDLKRLKREELRELSSEIREKILDVTSRKGGHLAASLGAVELTVALHYCLESPRDKIVWDVGHQCYAHKLLTGRNDRFETLREMGGISGFPNSFESEHDPFISGHSATSISSALGLAVARDLAGKDHKVVAVIGDASLSTGLAFEGMNQAGHLGTSMVVVLNDNEHSISKPVGAMSRYLNSVITNPLYNKVKEESEKIVKSIPKLGPVAHKTVKKFQEGLKNLLVPGILFEELGFRYFGPIDGHDIDQLISVMRKILVLKEPVFLHVITKKGKGYGFAEADPERFHGVGAFDLGTGNDVKRPNGEDLSFTGYFSRKMSKLGEKNPSIVGITAAMPEGTGLKAFAKAFPERFFDVGINEPHAVTFAAGLAKSGFTPIVAIYSTFLQRSYDQMIHDVALQRLPVIFCLDRAGLVGEDGPTHHGMFDISYSRMLPNFVVMAPKDGMELEEMLDNAVKWVKPVLIRYPKGDATRVVSSASCRPIEKGLSETLRRGEDLTIIALGSMVNTSLKAADILSGKGLEAEVVNARFVKPLDREMLDRVARKKKKIFIVEEGIISGGFGSGVLEFYEHQTIQGLGVRCLGLPDEFIEHGNREELLRKYHMTPDGIAEIIMSEKKKT
ncbi:MAG: 1-deoxy-D-xylulose-5-phosphate synthase [Candidatus Omnitrophica bacterium]|nr:1-deoxy-D-xylulose-5-phosphate synthase [Candidatus Omnitrophota bacterium]MDD5488220.1 1-deoxy-D-xylulose-5-phosphate synthase [Candidatus Omnitrophota bacterium]